MDHDEYKIFLSRQVSLREEKEEMKKDFNVLEFGKENRSFSYKFKDNYVKQVSFAKINKTFNL